jgi:hypothetical protein
LAMSDALSRNEVEEGLEAVLKLLKQSFQ